MYFHTREVKKVFKECSRHSISCFFIYVEGLVLWIDKKGVNLDILFRI